MSLIAFLACEATPTDYPVIWEAIQTLNSEQLSREIGNYVAQQSETVEESGRMRVGRARANAAITLSRMQNNDASLDILATAKDADAKSQFAYRAKRMGLSVDALLELLRSAERDENIYAIILGLGEFNLQELDGRATLILKLMFELYENHPSSRVHGATEWAMRQWSQDEELYSLAKQLCSSRPFDPSGTREWFYDNVAGEAVSFTVFLPGEYLIGSPPTEKGRSEIEKQNKVTVVRPFAVATKEVTRSQFIDYLTKTDDPVKDEYVRATSLYGGNDDCPATLITWHAAVDFCNWLSLKGDYRSEELCYVRVNASRVEAFHERPAYRLPTAVEWEIACRSGTSTPFSMGCDRVRLQDYGWFAENSEGVLARVGLLRPNHAGLFDMHGNVFEWCWDVFVNENSVYSASDSEEVERIARGGGWGSTINNSRSAYLVRYPPGYRHTGVGVRLFRTLPETRQ